MAFTSTAEQAPSVRVDWRTSITLGTLVAAATLPFIGKAFHVDDVLRIEMARQILTEPLDPYGAATRWNFKEESLFDTDYNPPLFMYVVALVIKFFGESEPALHLLESGFVACAAVPLYLLSQRFTRHPMAATALVLLSPAWLPGHNVMLEGPVMAFWLFALWCHLRACDGGRWGWTMASGMLVALGILTKYTSGVLLPLLLWTSVTRRKWKTLWFAVIPIAALGAWCWHNNLMYGRSHFGSKPMLWPDSELLVDRATGVLVGWGATSLVSGLVIVALLRKPTELAFGVVATGLHAGTILLGLADGRTDWTPSQRVHYAAFVINGAVTVYGLFVSSVLGIAERNHGARDVTSRNWVLDTWLLLAWVAVIAVFNCVSAPFLAVRHLLPAVPALVWLALRAFETTVFSPRLSRAVVATTVILNGMGGYLLAAADFEFAEAHRQLARHPMLEADGTQFPGVGTNRWHVGQWGWLYYAEQSGMRLYPAGRGESLADGDVIVFTEHSDFRTRIDRARQRTDESTIRFDIPRRIPVSTIGHRVHYYAFQTERFHALPWQFSREPVEVILLVRQEKDYGGTASGWRRQGDAW